MIYFKTVLSVCLERLRNARRKIIQSSTETRTGSTRQQGHSAAGQWQDSLPSAEFRSFMFNWPFDASVCGFMPARCIFQRRNLYHAMFPASCCLTNADSHQWVLMCLHSKVTGATRLILATRGTTFKRKPIAKAAQEITSASKQDTVTVLRQISCIGFIQPAVHSVIAAMTEMI